MDENVTSKARLVFVSHSSSDTWVAKQIAREIEARGGTPFLDEAEVDAGADFEEEIQGSLNRHTSWLSRLHPGRWIGRTYGLRLELRGDAESQSWLYCLESRLPSSRLDLTYPYSSRNATYYD